MGMKSWKKTQAGYSVSLKTGESVEVSKIGSSWFLMVGVREPVDLGRRGGFDQAEGVLASMGLA